MIGWLIAGAVIGAALCSGDDSKKSSHSSNQIVSQPTYNKVAYVQRNSYHNHYHTHKKYVINSKNSRNSRAQNYVWRVTWYSYRDGRDHVKTFRSRCSAIALKARLESYNDVSCVSIGKYFG